MIMTHNAGTCYYDGDPCALGRPLKQWSVNQPVGPLSLQLDCGARALEIRPHWTGEKLVFWHGEVDIGASSIDGINTFDTTFDDALVNVKQWAEAHPGELVLMITAHCSKNGYGGTVECMQKTNEAYEKAKISVVSAQDMRWMTVKQALEKGKVGSGGSVVAFWPDKLTLQTKWVSSLGCYKTGSGGTSSTIASLQTNASIRSDLSSTQIPPELQALFDGESGWNCLGKNKEKAFEAMWLYLKAVTSKQRGFFNQAQALWQYGGEATTLGITRDRCILQVTEKSGINRRVAESIRKDELGHINLLEVDNVCDGGSDILEALRGRIARGVF